MHYSDLLDRMREHDAEAFLEMTDRYGWTVYSFIRKKYADKETADRIYSDTMQAFCQALQMPGCEDPLEALLCAFSEKISGPMDPPEQREKDAADGEYDPEFPRIGLCEEAAEEDCSPDSGMKRNSGILSAVGMIFVTAGILVMLWVILGLLMSLELIPAADLGYSWFNANIARWF